MIVLYAADPVGKAECSGHFDFVLRLVLTVAASALGLDKYGRRQRVAAAQLRNVVENAIFIDKLRDFKLSIDLIAEAEGNTGVDDCLPLEGIQIIGDGDINIGEYIQVGLPADGGAAVCFGFVILMQTADIFAFFKMQLIALAVAPDTDVHIGGGILRRAGAQPIQSEE